MQDLGRIHQLIIPLMGRDLIFNIDVYSMKSSFVYGEAQMWQFCDIVIFSLGVSPLAVVNCCI